MKGLEFHLIAETGKFEIKAQELSHQEYDLTIHELVKHSYLKLSIGEISGNPPRYHRVDISCKADISPAEKITSFKDLVVVISNISNRPQEVSDILSENVYENLPRVPTIRTQISNVLNNMGVNTYQDLVNKYNEVKKENPNRSFDQFMRRQRHFGPKSLMYLKEHLKEKGIEHLFYEQHNQ